MIGDTLYQSVLPNKLSTDLQPENFMISKVYNFVNGNITQQQRKFLKNLKG